MQSLCSPWDCSQVGAPGSFLHSWSKSLYFFTFSKTGSIFFSSFLDPYLSKWPYCPSTCALLSYLTFVFSTNNNLVQNLIIFCPNCFPLFLIFLIWSPLHCSLGTFPSYKYDDDTPSVPFLVHSFIQNLLRTYCVLFCVLGTIVVNKRVKFHVHRIFLWGETDSKYTQSK